MAPLKIYCELTYVHKGGGQPGSSQGMAPQMYNVSLQSRNVSQLPSWVAPLKWYRELPHVDRGVEQVSPHE